MIEESLYNYIKDNIDNVTVYYGKVPMDFTYKNGDTSVNFIKLPSEASNVTPSYLDVFQITIRNKLISTVQTVAIDIIELFQLYYGVMGDYRIRVIGVSQLGTLYEDEDLVSIPLSLSIKYTGLN